jgi:thymidylate kinase
MKIIILEGIATSGKTTVKNLLISKFEKSGTNFAIIDENETLMPILENTDKKISLKLLTGILNKYFAVEKDVLIFDRLYFTHIFRTASSIKDFAKIENLLSRHNALLVLLIIEEQKISERIKNAMLHRDQKWTNFVREKGNDLDIEKYYIQQQQFLLELLNQSKLSHIIENSTNGNFEEIAENITNK